MYAVIVKLDRAKLGGEIIYQHGFVMHGQLIEMYCVHILFSFLRIGSGPISA
jgi:hypothetical protein